MIFCFIFCNLRILQCYILASFTGFAIFLTKVKRYRYNSPPIDLKNETCKRYFVQRAFDGRKFLPLPEFSPKPIVELPRSTHRKTPKQSKPAVQCNIETSEQTGDDSKRRSTKKSSSKKSQEEKQLPLKWTESLTPTTADKSSFKGGFNIHLIYCITFYLLLSFFCELYLV